MFRFGLMIKKKACAGVFLCLITLAGIAGQPAYSETHNVLGQVLYPYYQGDFEQTLVIIERLQQSDLTSEDNEQLTLIKGAASLSLGLIDQAQNAFEQVLDNTTDDQLRALSWYWMSRLAFEQKRYDLSRRAFDALDSDALSAMLSEEQIQHLSYQQGHIALLKSEANWQVHLAKLPQDNIYRLYLLYSAGAVAYQSANPADARQYFQQVLGAEAPEADKGGWGWLSWQWFINWGGDDVAVGSEGQAERREEWLALQDKTRLALGQVYLELNEYQQAIDTLTGINEQSPFLSQTLLTLAHSLYARGAHEQAMSLWQYLFQQPGNQTQVIAGLSLAQALERLGGEQQALNVYQQTLKMIEQTLKQVEALQAAITPDALTNDNLNALVQPGQNNINRAEALISDFLHMQGADALSRYQQLSSQTHDFAELQSRIADLHTLLDERELRRGHLAEQQQSLALDDTLKQLESRYQSLLAMQQRASDQPDLLASAQQLAWLDRTQGAQKRLEVISQHRATDAYEQRLSRIEGILIWQLNEQHPDALWQLTKQLRNVQQLIEQAQQQYAQLQSLGGQPSDIARARQRVEAMSVSVSTSANHHQVLVAQHKQHLTSLINNVLVAAKTQLQQQQVMSELAMVRMTDKQLLSAQQADATSTLEVQP